MPVLKGAYVLWDEEEREKAAIGRGPRAGPCLWEAAPKSCSEGRWGRGERSELGGGRARSGMGLEVGNVVAGGHFAPLERTVRQGAIPEVRLER